MNNEEWDKYMDLLTEAGTYKGLLKSLLDEECSYLQSIEDTAKRLQSKEVIGLFMEKNVSEKIVRAYTDDILWLCKTMRSTARSIMKNTDENLNKNNEAEK